LKSVDFVSRNLRFTDLPDTGHALRAIFLAVTAGFSAFPVGILDVIVLLHG